MEGFCKNAKGFSLVEVLVVMSLLLMVVTGGFVILSSGRSAWFTTDARVELQQNLRQTMDKMTRELNQSGFDKDGTAQYAIGDGTGDHGTDTIKFSIPVICHSTDNILDINSDIAHWGAPLTWGCTSSQCMDEDDVCATVEYKFIQYSIDSSNRLVREVLNPGNGVVRSDLLAQGITDLQITKSPDGSQLELIITGQQSSALKRVLTSSTIFEIYLRNRG